MHALDLQVAPWDLYLTDFPLALDDRSHCIPRGPRVPVFVQDERICTVVGGLPEPAEKAPVRSHVAAKHPLEGVRP